MLGEVTKVPEYVISEIEEGKKQRDRLIELAKKLRRPHVALVVSRVPSDDPIYSSEIYGGMKADLLLDETGLYRLEETGVTEIINGHSVSTVRQVEASPSDYNKFAASAEERVRRELETTAHSAYKG